MSPRQNTQPPSTTVRHTTLDRVTAFASVVAVLIALWVAWDTSRHNAAALAATDRSLKLSRDALEVQRRANAASLRPHLEVKTELGNPTPGHPNGRLARSTLQNKGLGPAQVRWVHVFLDGEKMPGGFLSALTKIGIPDDAPKKVAAFRDGHPWLSPGEDVLLYEVALDDTSAEAVKSLLTAQREKDRLDIRYCYCSLTGECWMHSKRPYNAGCRADLD